MAEKLLAVTTESVRNYVRLWNKEIHWPSAVLRRLAELGLDRVDVLYVLKEGDVVSSEKEDGHGAFMLIEGHTCDDVLVRIRCWMEVNAPLFKLLDIELV